MEAFIQKLISGSFFADAFSTFGWRDILDIFCLSVLFFALYLFVRDRRAGKLLTGVAMVVAIFVVSVLLDMYAIRYIFDGFFGYGLIVLAIIFQPELRAAMERLGSAPFNSLKNIGVETRELSASGAWVGAIVAAVKNMSFAKTGALIVIARQQELKAFADTGEIVDAAISSQLIENVFFKNTPLHDGAMIIRDGRILAAACILPVSKNTTLPKRYGLRHRAALGVTEKTDAIAIVVSEETGKISLAQGEGIKPITLAELEQQLAIIFGVENPEQNKK
jgi:uncharacterized protein (TIGR00159 family)